jgi:hypothetical protein
MGDRGIAEASQASFNVLAALARLSPILAAARKIIDIGNSPLRDHMSRST